MRRTAGALFLLLVLATPARAVVQPDSSRTLAALRREAKALKSLYHSAIVQAFLDVVPQLPSIPPRTILSDSSRSHYYAPSQAAALPESARSKLVTRTLGESFYYNTRYGSPLAYARPLELLAQSGFTGLRGSRIVDFGYGTVGHLRLLASHGADVHGIDVDPLLPVLYGEPGDQGMIAAGRRGPGHVTLHHGRFPAVRTLVDEVGGVYDVFISKNTLKNGYIHPAESVDPRMLVHLGVDDTTFVRAMARMLKPGGYAMIYNLCPAPSPPGKPYIPWADGRCPFSRELLEAEGFEVLVFDRDDSAAARNMGHALGWDSGASPMDLKKDLFATYTVARRRR